MRSSRHSMGSALAPIAARQRRADSAATRSTSATYCASPSPGQAPPRSNECAIARRWSAVSAATSAGSVGSTAARTLAYSARVLGRRDLVEPVTRRALAVPALEHAIENVLGRRVHDDARQVLAADEVDVIDAQVGRYRFVAERPVRALPLDDERWPAAQRVACAEKGLPVHERRDEQVAVRAVLPRPLQPFEVVGADVLEHGRHVVECLADVVGAAHAEPGHHLGDQGLEVGH